MSDGEFARKDITTIQDQKVAHIYSSFDPSHYKKQGWTTIQHWQREKQPYHWRRLHLLSMALLFGEDYSRKPKCVRNQRLRLCLNGRTIYHRNGSQEQSYNFVKRGTTAASHSTEISIILWYKAVKWTGFFLGKFQWWARSPFDVGCKGHPLSMAHLDRWL